MDLGLGLGLRVYLSPLTPSVKGSLRFNQIDVQANELQKASATRAVSGNFLSEDQTPDTRAPDGRKRGLTKLASARCSREASSKAQKRAVAGTIRNFFWMMFKEVLSSAIFEDTCTHPQITCSLPAPLSGTLTSLLPPSPTPLQARKSVDNVSTAEAH